MYCTMGLKPQTMTVLRHMATAGSITQREALLDHAVQSLTKQISEIKNAGIGIGREFKRHPITGQRYARYALLNPHLLPL